MQQLILASNNPGKLREVRDILSPLGYNVLCAKEAGFAGEVAETAETFDGNALLKARAVFDALHTPVLADDSGLLVDALGGAPGVRSHRFAGEEASDADRCEKLLSLLKDVPPMERTARFSCAMCYIAQNGEAHFFHGTCEGIIGESPRGENGFGYDPVFYVGERSMAQLSESEKNQISHRGAALREMQAYFAGLQKKSGLSSKQRAALRGFAQNCETILQVGKGGINDALVQSVREALQKRELIKMRVLENCPLSARKAAEELAKRTKSEVVQVIGSRFVLFKRNPQHIVVKF